MFSSIPVWVTYITYYCFLYSVRGLRRKTSCLVVKPVSRKCWCSGHHTEFPVAVMIHIKDVKNVLIIWRYCWKSEILFFILGMVTFESALWFKKKINFSNSYKEREDEEPVTARIKLCTSVCHQGLLFLPQIRSCFGIQMHFFFPSHTSFRWKIPK